MSFEQPGPDLYDMNVNLQVRLSNADVPIMCGYAFPISSFVTNENDFRDYMILTWRTKPLF